MFVVFDLDGTLADDRERHHFILQEPKNWDGYFAACSQDKPVWSIIAVLHALAKDGHKIEIWTGRSDKYRYETDRWLNDYGILQVVSGVRMRLDGDHRPDTVVKGEWLEACGNNRPYLMVDDRNRSVAFWREQGLTCLHVADHDY